MSRAFVKEIDDAPGEIADRPVGDAPNYVTPQGAAMIDRELAAIEGKLAAGVADADEPSLRRDLRYWSARRSTMQVTEANDPPLTVTFGTKVLIRRRGRKLRIAIVGEDEADPSRNLIAWTSPLAEALLGAGPGDVIDFEAGGNEEEITVLSIKRLSA